MRQRAAMLAMTETKKQANGALANVAAANGAALPLLGSDTAARFVARLRLFTGTNKRAGPRHGARVFAARAVMIDSPRDSIPCGSLAH